MLHLVKLEDHYHTRCGFLLPVEGEEALFDVDDFGKRMADGVSVCPGCAKSAGFGNTGPDVVEIQ